MGFLQSKATLTIDNTIIDFTTYPFTWTYTDSDDDTPSYLEVDIPNLTKEFRESITTDSSVVFNFGFDDDVGTLIQGYVDKKTHSMEDAVTDKTHIKVLDTDSNVYETVTKTYINKSTKYIITDLADKLGLIVKELDLKNNISHINDYVCYGKGLPLLKKLVNQCGSKLRIEGNQIFVYNPSNESTDNYYLITFDTGLLSPPEEYTEDKKEYTHSFTCLANHNLRKGSVVRVECDDFKQYCKILKMSLTDWTATYYVKTLEV